jgi:hypothetical protein
MEPEVETDEGSDGSYDAGKVLFDLFHFEHGRIAWEKIVLTGSESEVCNRI